MSDVDAQLQHLADALVRPREDDGTEATLTALLPCEPAVGDVAVACWVDSAGGELLELVRLETGERLDDQVALREALTLLGMVETLEELASFEEVAELQAALVAWKASHTELDERFVRAIDGAVAALDAVVACSPGDAARIARPMILDALGGALRQLERSWELLEQAAELWSDAQLAATPGDQASLDRVQGLWRMLGVARRSALARPVGDALRAGREAGAAMAAEITG